MVLRFGHAVGATVATYSEFDRKHYFYPDIPKAYQISQYAYPFLTGGALAGVALTRVHLEEDTARSQHDQGNYSVVDFNRAGVPLMELVTEPVIHDAETAGHFARELQLLLRTLGISFANMEKGEMRVEANISVSTDLAQLGTKVEVKNLNSFRSVELAIAYETARQIAALEAGETIVQETRGWDEQKLRTFTQRSKETAKDYRYFPDPDIPKVATHIYPPFATAVLSENMPVLPAEKREKYSYLGIPSNQIEIIIADQKLDTFFSSVLAVVQDSPAVVAAANYTCSDVLALLQSTDKNYVLETLGPAQFAELMKMVVAKEISSRVAKDLLPQLFLTDAMPRVLATEQGLLQQSDATTLVPLVQQIITEHAGAVAEYKAGKAASLQFLVGQGMKATRGAADPVQLGDLFKQAIEAAK
jgi:aspartyl-tRNA(Asn)/glutamyl-tRNA(Gln) amidotransferase subunit B